jgi:hypothetical protein
MQRRLVVVASATASLLFSAAALAQTVPGSQPAQKQCAGLSGEALDSCLKSAPGRSGDATSRSGDRTPGSSENAASRAGTPPARDADAMSNPAKSGMAEPRSVTK